MAPNVSKNAKTNRGASTKKVLVLNGKEYEVVPALFIGKTAGKRNYMAVQDKASKTLLLDDNGMPLVALHWENRLSRMVDKYNDIYRIQMPNITPHVCRHTYCSNQAKAGMNPKTLQYLMGHSEIGVTIPIPNGNTKPTAVHTDINNTDIPYLIIIKGRYIRFCVWCNIMIE